MTQERVCANDTGVPKGSLERLAMFAKWTNTTPPEHIINGKGHDQTFSDDILIYADKNGMSLDWFWLGDERGLVMAAHHQARGTFQ